MIILNLSKGKRRSDCDSAGLVALGFPGGMPEIHLHSFRQLRLFLYWISLFCKL